MINQDLVEKLLIETFNIQNLKTATITYNTPAKDQIEIFGNFGLMLSPHGSQLTGLIFSQVIFLSFSFFLSFFLSFWNQK